MHPYTNQKKMVITGLMQQNKKRKKKEKEGKMYISKTIYDLNLQGCNIVKAKINNLDEIKRRFKNQNLTLVSDESQKDKLLTYGLVLECNSVRIKASGIVPSYVNELSSYQTEMGGCYARLELIIKLK